MDESYKLFLKNVFFIFLIFNYKLFKFIKILFKFINRTHKINIKKIY